MGNGRSERVAVEGVIVEASTRKANALHNTAFFAPGPPRSIASNAGTALGVASFGFLCALAVGAVLLIGAKLQAPDLGAGASPLSIFKSIVIVSLGGLGGSVEIGRLSVFAIPLGGLLFTGLGLAWAAQSMYGRHRSLEWSLAVGVLLGGMCALAAILCDLGEGVDRIRVASHEVFGIGVIWGTLFSLVRSPAATDDGTRISARGLAVRMARGRAIEGSGALRSGINLGLSLLMLSAVVAIAAGFVYVITRSSSVPAAVGIVIHALAFLPNLAGSLAAFVLGSPVEAGLGSLASTDAGVAAYSLLDWKDGIAPAYMWLLALLPLAALTAAGGRMRQACEHRSTNATVLYWLGSSIVFAWLLGTAAGLSSAQVGADLQTEGFLRLSTHPAKVFGVALVWAAVGLPLGWAVSAARAGRRESSSIPNER